MAPICLERAIWLRRFSRCPPARWPVSCAMTPISSFGVSRGEHRAGVDHHPPAACDEGVEVAVLQDDDLGAARADAGRPEHRLGIVAQQRLDLGIADDGLAGALRDRGRGRKARRQGKREDGAERSLPALASPLIAEQESRRFHRLQTLQTLSSSEQTQQIPPLARTPPPGKSKRDQNAEIVATKRRGAVPGHGRAGAGGGARGAGTSHRAYGGRTARRFGAEGGARRGGRGAERAGSATPRRSGYGRCASASRAITASSTGSTCRRRGS